jgi:hypothetical protein
VFEEVARLIKGTGDAQRSDEISALSHYVTYHSDLAQNAFEAARSAIDGFSCTLNKGPAPTLRVTWAPEGGIFYADVAVREALSSFDSSLWLINRVLRLGLRATQVRWKDGSKPGPLNKRLSAQTYRPLFSTLDGVFDSIGYDALKNYRDWVTHRGAPRLLTINTNWNPIRISSRVCVLPDDLLQLEMRRIVLEATWDDVLVECAPFAPGALMVVNATLDGSSGLQIPGLLNLSPGTTGTIRGLTVVQ